MPALSQHHYSLYNEFLLSHYKSVYDASNFEAGRVALFLIFFKRQIPVQPAYIILPEVVRD
jgi:hypothetical protein